MQALTKILVVILLISLNLSLNVGLIDVQAAELDQNDAGLPSIENEGSSIRLDSILKHQIELREQCKRLEHRELIRLHQRAGSAMPNGHQARLPSLGTYQLPAVCLFLLNWDATRESGSNSSERLQLINWMAQPEELHRYHHHDHDHLHDDDLITGSAHQSSSQPMKRDKKHTLGYDELDMNEIESSSPPSLNANELNERQPNEARQDGLTRQEVGELMHDKQFRQAIENYRDRLEPELSPVILVPGLLGSRLQAKLDKTKRVNVFCKRQSDSWQEMWLSVKNFLPFLVDCWFDNARLVFDPETGFARSPMGVTVRVPDFGSVKSVRSMDLNSMRVSRYYAQIIDHYVRLGYKPDKNLLAAPYDFRLAPQQLTDSYFKQLDGLIEASSSSARLPVTLVCHSMGCTHMLIYLRSKEPSWRSRHVRKLIALSAPWGGTVKALKAILVGDQLDLPLVSELKMRNLARTFPSMAYLLPQAEIFRSAGNRALDGQPVPLVQVAERTYGPAQLVELLQQLNLTHQARWYQETTALIRPMEPISDLKVDCVHSANVPTMETILFRNAHDFPNGPYELLRGPGDGTVNLDSLQVCQEWARQLPELVRYQVIENTNHVGMLSDPRTLRLITDDVLLDNSM